VRELRGGKKAEPLWAKEIRKNACRFRLLSLALAGYDGTWYERLRILSEAN
jgi:hypothetical protein